MPESVVPAALAKLSPRWRKFCITLANCGPHEAARRHNADAWTVQRECDRPDFALAYRDALNVWMQSKLFEHVEGIKKAKWHDGVVVGWQVERDGRLTLDIASRLNAELRTQTKVEHDHTGSVRHVIDYGNNPEATALTEKRRAGILADVQKLLEAPAVLSEQDSAVDAEFSEVKPTEEKTGVLVVDGVEL